MKSCKSKYDYEQLVQNYIEHNVYNTSYKEQHSSTASNRLSFHGSRLYSYNTAIANFVKLDNKLWCLITNNSYSITTTKQTGKLMNKLTEWDIPFIATSAIFTDSINLILEENYNKLINIYKTLPAKRNMQTYKQSIDCIISFLKTQKNSYPKEVKPYLNNITKLPNIPKKMDTFTRPAFKLELKRIGLSPKD